MKLHGASYCSIFSFLFPISLFTIVYSILFPVSFTQLSVLCFISGLVAYPNILREILCSFFGLLPRTVYLCVFFVSWKLNTDLSVLVSPYSPYLSVLCFISEPVFVHKPLQEPRNRFPAWRANTTTLFIVLTCQCWNC